MYQPTKADIANEGVYLAQNMQVIGAGKNTTYRLFKNLVCGHEQEAHTGCVQKGVFRCKTCLLKKFEDEASAEGLTIIGTFVKNRNTHGKYKFNNCGHYHETQVSHVRKGLVKCQVCQDQKFRNEAIAVGAKYLENLNGQNGRFQLACGHEQTIGFGEIRKNSFRCQTCEDTWVTKPSNLYLHKIEYQGNILLKFGRARNVDFRITRYGLAEGTVLTVLKTWPTKTGIEADKIETLVAKKFNQYSKAKAKLIFRENGHTECFYVDDQQAVIDFVEQQLTKQTFAPLQIGLH